MSVYRDMCVEWVPRVLPGGSVKEIPKWASILPNLNCGPTVTIILKSKFNSTLIEKY